VAQATKLISSKILNISVVCHMNEHGLTSKWRKAKIRFLTRQTHNRLDYGISAHACDIIHPGEEREVYFEWGDKGIEGCKPGTRFAHIGLHDLIIMSDEDFEIIELHAPEEFHPTEIMLKKIQAQSEQMVENIINVAAQ
jgi:hypothetical protein